MERKAYLGINFPAKVTFIHNPGKLSSLRHASVPEYVDVTEISIAGAGAVTPEQFAAIMDEYEVDITDDCLDHAGAELEVAGWTFDPYAQVWTPPESCKVVNTKQTLRLNLYLSLAVTYIHHPGEPATPDCPAVPESVEVLDIIIADGGPATTEQFKALMREYEVDIVDACLDHAGTELEAAGWAYDPYARVWASPNGGKGVLCQHLED